ncbi:MAG: amidohydrolase [Clostridiales Family XIII bacterium]|jgi:predicted amidohydrolase YtcJ|nr:amidohydrolase [Clostridiales Family XIII bacterium]
MSADLVIKGNAIFDSIADAPYQGAVVVKGNKIQKVLQGDAIRDINDYINDDTKVIDAGDRTVMAGFHDSHVHFLLAGLYQTYPELTTCVSEQEVVDKVFEASKAIEDKDGWMFGFGWYTSFWDVKVDPTKASLDKAFPDRPVILLNAEAHGAWVNSKALEIAGITKDTKDPEAGIIIRDANGEPTGYLHEGAVGLVTTYAMDFSKEQMKQLIRAFFNGAKEFGITSINDVMPLYHGDIGDVSVYSEMDQSGELTTRVHAAPDLLGDLDKVLELKDKYTSDRLKINQVKQFIDGVSTTHTALMLEDYTDAPGNKGVELYDFKAMGRAVPEAHKRGLSVKLHSCGDRSCRYALDFYENAIKLYGKNECRHAIEHCEIVDPTDLPRFKELGIIPSVQPEHIAISQKFDEDPYFIAMGDERANRTWPLKTLLELTGVLAIGSDCPVVDNNPFLEIYRGVTRLFNDGEPKGGWNPTQKLTLAEVLRSYTWGSAYGVRREDELGSLKAGNFADIIVIDRNLFGVPESELIDGKVDVTIFDGNVIYERK